MKTFALSGGAFVVARSFPRKQEPTSAVQRILDPFIPYGKIFFSIMLIIFGIDHFLYTDFVATLIPSWLPWPVFWTYFGAVALIGSGSAMILNIKRRQVAVLTGIMLFIWLLILHIPRAITYPSTDKGNELTSVFEALAFSGVAFLIAKSGSKNDPLPQRQ